MHNFISDAVKKLEFRCYVCGRHHMDVLKVDGTVVIETMCPRCKTIHKMTLTDRVAKQVEEARKAI